MVTGFGDEDQVVDDGTSDGVFAEGEVVEEDHQVVVTPKKETLALPPQKAPAPPPSTKQEVANCFGFDSVSFFLNANFLQTKCKRVILPSRQVPSRGKVSLDILPYPQFLSKRSLIR